MAFGQRRSGDPGQDVAHVAGKLLRPLVGQRIERVGGAAVRARRAAEPQIDAARRDRVEHAELLGHLQRRIVRQHDAGAADADARRGGRDRADQHLRRGADDRAVAVVLRHPEALIAEALAHLASAIVWRIASPCGRPAMATDWSRTDSGSKRRSSGRRTPVNENGDSHHFRYVPRSIDRRQRGCPDFQPPKIWRWPMLRNNCCTIDWSLVLADGVVRLMKSNTLPSFMP